MSVQYLFNSYGDWIAFRKGEFVFDTDGNWLGWLPWGDLEIVDVSGEYLGTIESDRLYRLLLKTCPSINAASVVNFCWMIL